jgi:UDP-3-O-[3-hydroxymyristoyl] N-acetylglucosamine deacetylase
VGIHTGDACCATVSPAEADSGVVFTDGTRRFRVGPGCVGETTRCTTVEGDGLVVRTVEHLLAALFGLAVDNATIRVDGPELPILDGSALPWVAALRRAGSVSLERPVMAYRPSDVVVVADRASCAVATPARGLVLTCVTHYESPMLGTQSATVRMGPREFADQVAPARTFALAKEVEHILGSGLARGGDLSNALVVYDDRYSDTLRMPDECLKHKMLDLLGDLSVLGVRLQAHVTVYRPGHGLNAALVRALARGLPAALPR